MLRVPVPSSNGRRIAATAIAGGVYLAAAKIGLQFAATHPSTAAVWPPAGIALATLLLLGGTAWPGIFLGAFVANLNAAGTVWTSLGIATGNTLEGLMGAYLVRTYANGTGAFNRPQDIFRFAVLAAALSPAAGATIGVTSLALAGSAPWAAYMPNWFTWWLGDAGGALIVAPLIILWGRSPRLQWDRQARTERGLFLVGLLVVDVIVFSGWFASPYMVVPFLVWAAFRFEQKETATVIALLSAGAVEGTMQGRGPLVGATPNESLLLLRTFMGIMTLVALPLSSVVSERERLFKAEQFARRAAEQESRRIARLQAATMALAQTAGSEEVARTVIEDGMKALGAQAGGLALVTEDGAALRAICEVGFDGALMRHWQRVPLSAPTLATKAVRSGKPIFFEDPTGERDRHLERVWATAGISAQAAIPLMIGSRAIGVLIFASFAAAKDVEQDRAFVIALADLCVHALERARLYDRERRAAETLQQAFLPRAIPQVPGARIDAAYLPGSAESRVGGDWYDVFPLQDGSIALSVGDVVGHGLTAAVTMSQLRQGIRAAALLDPDPSTVLDRADDLLTAMLDTDVMATAIFGIFDPVTMAFTYAVAGHPSAALCAKEGSVEFLPSGGGPLGINAADLRPTRGVQLHLGSLLVLYTDGLVEGTQNVPEGRAALVRAIRGASREGVTEHAHRILDGALEGRPPADDIAVVTLALARAPIDRFELTLLAEPRSLPRVRQALRQLTTRLRLTEDQANKVEVAVSEAVNNVVAHAYGASVGELRVGARRDGHWLRMEVEDYGRWRPARPDDTGGYGIPTMRTLVDEVEINERPAGTLVRLGIKLSDAVPDTSDLPQPITPLKVAATAGARTAQQEGLPVMSISRAGPFQVREVKGIPVVDVAGDVDFSNAHRLQAALEQAAGADRRAVVVSLEGATYFDSQGTHSLLRFSRRLEMNRQRLLVVVPKDHPLKAIFDAIGVAANIAMAESLDEAITLAQADRP